MENFIREILIYIIVVTVFRSLIRDEGYAGYYRFIAGMILVLIILTPAVNFLYGDGDVYKVVTEKLVDSYDEFSDLEFSGEDYGFERKVEDECRDIVSKKIKNMARKRDITVDSVEVYLESQNEEMRVKKLKIRIDKGGDELSLSEFKNQVAEYYSLEEADVKIWI